MIRPDQKTRLSRVISHALRHAPQTYGLTLDENDSVELSELVSILRRSAKEFSELDELDVVELTLNAEKVRHQIKAGRIQALYGHSISSKQTMTAVDAPSMLFHGTSPSSVTAILEQGLKPMRRRFVHLSSDLETARIVGRRKSPEPAILEIRARSAEQEGEKFFQVADKIWLTSKIQAKFLTLIE
jgi:putative RNA 2'-phosphotransferase